MHLSVWRQLLICLWNLQLDTQLLGVFWGAGEKGILTRSVEQREVKPCTGSEFSLNRNVWCTQDLNCLLGGAAFCLM